MTMTLDGTNGLTFNDTSLQGAAASPYVLKNRIINGDMRIDQRNAGASVTPSADTYLVDRWQYSASQTSKFTWQQNKGAITSPAGFSNYLGGSVASAVTVGAADYFALIQKIEGFNSADLAWGTANAKTVTLSFQVYSSLTGTFGGTLVNSNSTRNYPFTYSIPTANTWTTIAVTIAGDTSGTWNTTTGIGVGIQFGLGVGSTYSGTAGSWGGTQYISATGATSVVGTASATFYITGVQLEIGTSATPFERRLYDKELVSCQRYGFAVNGAYMGYGNGTTVVDAACMFPVTMRSSPTLTAGTAIMTSFGTGGAITQSSVSSSLPNNVNQNGCTLRFNNFTGLTNNNVYLLNQNSGPALVTVYSSFLSAEL